MENEAPAAQADHPLDSQTIFTELRDALATLYSDEQAARVIVDDTGLVASHITFSSRAQTNWHNILTEALHQNRMDTLLQMVCSTYGNNPAFQEACDQYRHWIEQGGHIEPPIPLSADSGQTPSIETRGGTYIAGDVTAGRGDIIGRDQQVEGDKIGRDKIEGDQVNAHNAKGFINRPTGPVTQHFGNTIQIGSLQIPKPLVWILLVAIVISVGIIGSIALNTRTISTAITAPTPTASPIIPTSTPTMTPTPTATPLAFATQANDETLIVIATFHNTADTNSEAHIKIRRAIANEAANYKEQQLRVEKEPTELTADQRMEAEALGKRYNASMVIWGEDTGVEVIVNFFNLKEPNFDAASATITETERSQLANPNAYVRFITHDLPSTMSFFVFFTIGQSYYWNTQYVLAIERIETAVTLVPSTVKPEGLADAYFRLGWLYQVHTPNNLNAAIADYTKAIELQSDYADAYNNRGLARIDQGKLDEAITDLDKAINLNHDYVDAYNNRGLAYAGQGKLNEAIVEYDKAITLNPNYAKAYYNRGIVYSIQGRLDEVIAEYDKAINLKPDFAEAYNNRGNIRASQGKLDEAITDYDKAINLKPDFAEAYNNRGNIRKAQGKLDEAITDYDKVIQLDPKLAEAYNNRGNVFQTQGKLDEAIADYDKATNLKPGYADAYFNRGIVHFTQGKLEEAIADLDKVIVLKPDSSIVLPIRGVIYRKLGKFREALSDFRRYLELKPNSEHRVEVEKWILEVEAELAKPK